LRRSDLPSKETYRLCIDKETEKAAKVHKGCIAIERWIDVSHLAIYRVIQEELPPLMELISEDILSKRCHINLGPIRYVRNWNFSKFQF
jgi:hypothetical protein